MIHPMQTLDKDFRWNEYPQIFSVKRVIANHFVGTSNPSPNRSPSPWASRIFVYFRLFTMSWVCEVGFYSFLIPHLQFNDWTGDLTVS